MSDIVERLRNDQGVGINLTLCREAADEIERLRAGGCARNQRTTQFCAEAVDANARAQRAEAQNAKLREALQWYVDNDGANEGGDWEKVNAFWREGRTRAIALLAALATGGDDVLPQE